MSLPTPSDCIVILGQNKIIVTVLPSTIVGNFDVRVDTSNFSPGIPFAVQCLLQATMALVPVAYQTIVNAVKE